MLSAKLSYCLCFNSRPHRGRRQLRQVDHIIERCFNSRPHRGRQFRNFSLTEHFHVSTHALTEGDIRLLEVIGNSAVSTHALTEGDILDLLDFGSGTCFNSRPHRGRPKVAFGIGTYLSFQLTPSQRATHI